MMMMGMGMGDTPSLPSVSKNGKYDYDLIVIGGGSGGLAASKRAVKENPGMRVAVFDKVTPTPHGIEWGLGGTCVNVGCIPKKLFHYASMAHSQLNDFKAMGWDEWSAEGFNWDTMVENVDNYVSGMQYGYQNQLRDNAVEYINAVASFADAHSVNYTDVDGKTAKTVSSERFIVAVGGRPNYPTIPGAQLALTSDDIFWWKKAVGKTLVIGGSYIALECAGFLQGLGFDTTVMVRSILLRGFDQQCARQIGEIMELKGVRFINPCVPSSLTKTDDGKISVVYRYVDGDNKDQEVTEVFDTVLFAIGRTALTDQVNIQATGVKTHARSSKIIVTDAEETNVSHIYAIGDCVCDANGKSRPELTPVAIKAGELLSARVFGGASKVMDYTYIATTVFTPIEYGVCGLSEEEAREIHGDDNVEVYHVRYGTLETAVAYVLDVPPPRTQCFCGKNYYAKEFALAHGNEWIDHDVAEYEFEERQRKHLKQPNLAKLVVDKKNDERVIGFHYIGPQAGEVTQGFALALKKGATKADFDDLVGIHPTTAEEFCSLKITKSSGEDFMKKGGC